MVDPTSQPSPSPNGSARLPGIGAVTFDAPTASSSSSSSSSCFRLAVSGVQGQSPCPSVAEATSEPVDASLIPDGSEVDQARGDASESPGGASVGGRDGSDRGFWEKPPTSLDPTETSVSPGTGVADDGLKSPETIRQEFDKWWSERSVTRRELGDSNAVAVSGDLSPELDESSCLAKFRHNSWRVNRRRVWESMQRTAQSVSRRRAFGQCGCHSWIEQSSSEPGKFRVRCDHCGDRLCVPCGVKRSAKVQRALAAVCRGKRLTFITLTLCGRGEPLAEMLDRLYKHFRALRLLPIWEKVEGGAAFLEIKWSDKAKRWHPHLHLICEAGWVDQGSLSDCWRMLTKDSYIVDVRRVADEDAAFRYVTKYASKPLSPTFLGATRLIDEAIIALKGRRLIFCFGTWYGTPLDQVEEDELDGLEEESGWRYFAPMEQILSEATRGSRDALQILRALNVEGLWRASLESG